MTFSIDLIVLGFVIACVVMGGIAMCRAADRTMIANMREDGLTEGDIQDILGTQGYNKARGR